MDTQPLNVKIDSGQAQADLAALARALDNTGAAAGRMAAGMSSGMSKADQSIKGSMANMERFAQVAGLVNRIKINGDGVKAVADFARVLQQVARVQEIDRAKIESWSKFIQLGAQTSRLKIDMGATNALNGFVGAMNNAAKTREISAGKLQSWAKFIELGARSSQLRMGAASMVGFNMFAQAMDNVAKSRSISASKLKSWVDFIEVAARAQHLKFDPAVSRSLLDFGRAMEGFKAPGKGSIDRLGKMFTVLASAKPIPNARAVANDLDMIAQSATRAAAALSAMPGGRFNLGGGGRRGGGGNGGGAAAGPNNGPAMRGVASSAGAAGGGMDKFAAGADRASKSSYTLGERLRGLNHRFDLAYQAGTIFNTLFGAFTLGGMIKGVYDATIELQKLEKAMLFTTKSYDGSKQATNEFIGTVFSMGLALDQVSEPFGRFTISAGAVGMSAKESGAIFESVTRTLQVVGASAAQTGYAMYGLTQMIQKGKVSSEEFSRQIGEQIPGNAEAGRRALQRMKGEAVSMQQFFKEMSLGNIQSAEFTKLWAEELDSMFGDLKGLIEGRPDIAINRLKTAFTVFQQEVGKSAFMSEVGIQMNRLANMFGEMENGVFKLKPQFKELADMLGRNLARMMRMAGDAALWVAENFDKLLFAAKAVATLFVARTFLSWGQSAMTALGSIQGLTKAFTGLTIAKKAAAAADAGASASAGASAATNIAAQTSRAKAAVPAAASLVGGSMADIQNWRNANGIKPGRDIDAGAPFAAGFGKRQGAWNPSSSTARAFGPATASATSSVIAQRAALSGAATAASARASGGMLGRLGGAAAGAAVGAAAAAPAAGAAMMRGLASAGKVAALALGGFGVAAVATGAALTILSDKSTKLGDATIKFGDILTGALRSVSDRLGGWMDRFFNSGKGMQGFLDSIGPAFQTAVNYLVLFGEVLGDTVGAVMHVFKALTLAAQGDLKGAGDAFKQIAKDWADNNPFDRANMERRDLDGRQATYQAALERLQGERANSDAERLGREAAALLAARSAADDQLAAARLQKDAAEEMTKAMEIPTMASVTERIGKIASGEFARLNPAKTAEQRAAENVAVRDAAAAATSATDTAATPASTIRPAEALNNYTFSYEGKNFSAPTREALTQAVYAEFAKAPATPAAQASAQPPRGFWDSLRDGLRSNLTPSLDANNRRLTSALTRGNPEQQRAADAARYRRAGEIAHTAGLAARVQEETVQAALNASGGSALDRTMAILRAKEGFESKAYDDGPRDRTTGRRVGAAVWRAGYGSNTITDPNSGQISTIRQGQTVTVAQAEADLRRRTADFMNGVKSEVGAEQFGKLSPAAQAALTSVAYNYGTIGRTRGGGGAGIADEIRSGQVSNEQIAALIEGLAGHNGGINKTRRLEEAAYVRSGGADGIKGVAGVASAGGTGPTAASIAEDEKAKELAQKSNDWKSLQSVLALPDPASQAVSRANAMAEQLNDLAIRDEARIEKYGDGAKLLTTEVVSQIEAAKTRLFKEIGDSMNPVAKANRLMEQTNDLTLLTVRGKGEEAAWQERINDLKEQGYDIDLMQDEAKWAEHINRLRTQGILVEVDSLNVAKQKWKVERDRTATLQAEVRLLDTINEARMRLMKVDGSTSTRDSYLADLVNQTSDSGTYDQKLANAQSNPGLMRALNRTADVQALSDQAEAARSIVVQASDQLEDVTGSVVDRRVRATYRDTLRDLTGMSNATLREIEASLLKLSDGSGKAIMDLASQVAKARESLENPPGFRAWVDGLEPFAQRMEDIKGAFMEGLSDGITDELMGEDVDWQSIFKNIRRQITKASVDEALSGMLGFMGIKKTQGSPEVQAMADSAQRLYEAASRNIESINAARDADLAAAEALRDVTENQKTQVQQQVEALRASAMALEALAAKFTDGSYTKTLFTNTANDQREQAMAIQSGDGYSASGAPIANVALLAAPTTQPGAEALSMPRAPRLMDLMVKAPAIQGTTPAAARDVGETRDTTSFARRAIGLISGKANTTAETSFRNTTAGVMSNAPSAGPLALSLDAADEAGSEAGQALFAAANALMGVPTAFAGPVGAFNTSIEKFAEAIKKLEQAAQALASSGGGSGGGMDIPFPGYGELTTGGDGFGGSDLSGLQGLYASGGYVAGAGGPRSDSINARLSNGEFVINAAATAQHRGLLEAINSGKAFASGGYVDGLPGYFMGGFISGLGSKIGALKPSNLKASLFGSSDVSAGDMMSIAKSGIFGKGRNGKYDGPMSMFGEMFGRGNSMETRAGGGLKALTMIANIADMFKKEEKEEVYKPVNGVIGEHRAVTVDGTEVAAKSNMIADIIDIGANMLTGGAWGKVSTYRQMALGAVKTIGDAFADGGYVSSSGAGGMDWGSVPHYDVGTPNTSNGGMPAVVHPNEAIIPLPNGRAVPVDFSGVDMGGRAAGNVTTNVTVIAPNPDAFRKSQGAIQTQTNRNMKRSAARNLTG